MESAKLAKVEGEELKKKKKSPITRVLLYLARAVIKMAYLFVPCKSCN